MLQLEYFSSSVFPVFPLTRYRQSENLGQELVFTTTVNRNLFLYTKICLQLNSTTSVFGKLGGSIAATQVRIFKYLTRGVPFVYEKQSFFVFPNLKIKK